MQYGRRSATSSPQLRIVLSLKLHRKGLLELRMCFLVTITSDRGQTAGSRGVTALLSLDLSPFLRRNQEPLHLGRQARAGWQPSNWLVPPPLAASQPLAAPLKCTSKTTDGKESSEHFSFKMSSWAHFENITPGQSNSESHFLEMVGASLDRESAFLRISSNNLIF